MTCYIGIDVGLAGGIAILHEGMPHPWVRAMPLLPGKRRRIDERKLCEIVAGTQSCEPFAILEEHRPFLKPGQRQPGAYALFRLGEKYGFIRGLLVALVIPFQEVAPRKWQKVYRISKETKIQSIEMAGRLFPGVDLRATARCRKLHDGMADALLMAEYGRRLHAGGGL